MKRWKEKTEHVAKHSREYLSLSLELGHCDLIRKAGTLKATLMDVTLLNAERADGMNTSERS